MHCLGPDQSENWCGQDTENLIREVVECSMTLMEMAEIDAEDTPVEYSPEVKQQAVTLYLFGCLLLRAAKYEEQDKESNSTVHLSKHLS